MTSTLTPLDAVPAQYDLDYFIKLGRFNRRMLAEELGILADSKEKAAYMSANDADQSKAVMALVDQKRKGSKAATGGASPRQPSNKGSKAAKAAAASEGTTTAPTSAPAAASSKGGGGENAQLVLERLDALIASTRQQTNAVKELTSAIQELQSIAAGTNRFVTMSIGCSLKLAEQVLGAGPADVLRFVVEDLPIVDSALEALSPGAPAGNGGDGGGDEEEEEDEEDGDEEEEEGN